MDTHAQQRLFGILYALAARDGRQDALFGQNPSAAFEAFAHSTACETFPEVWFEVPLKGDPWFDLHLLVSKEALSADMVFAAESTGGFPEAFGWFAGQEGVRQLALSWDVGGGEAGVPAVQVLVSGQDPEVSCSFLRALGRDDLQGAYRTFVQRIPDSWFACYTGAFPSRAHDFVRVECIVNEQLQRAYAQDGSLIEAHLRQAGVAALDETCVLRCQELARSPFQVEFQFDVLPDGTLGSTFAMSARFASPAEEGDRAFDPNGHAGALMECVEAWGLADSRWRLLADTTFAERVTWKGSSCVLFNYPAFVKLRWRDGQPLDAKSYLLAGVQG